MSHRSISKLIIQKYDLTIRNDIPNTMSEFGLIYLAMLAKLVPKGGLIVEAGALYGCSSATFAANAPRSAKIYAIDPWQDVPWVQRFRDKNYPNALPLSRAAFEYYTTDYPNIVPVQGYAPDALSWSDPIDLFFEDAYHSNPVVARNLERFARQLSPGGIMAGDDYSHAFPDVISEVDHLHQQWGAPAAGLAGLVWALAKPGGRDLNERLTTRWPHLPKTELVFEDDSTFVSTGLCYALKSTAASLVRFDHGPDYELTAYLGDRVVGRSAKGVLHLDPGQMVDRVDLRLLQGTGPVALELQSLDRNGKRIWSTFGVSAKFKTPNPITNAKLVAF